MEQELVSVVIPTYNREKVIKRSIDSVLCQSYENIEVIVVDDGSTDDTIEQLKNIFDDRLKVIQCRDNQGASHARNIGIRASSGKYVAFQDSDDEWLENKLKDQIAFMKDNAFQVSFTSYFLEEAGGVSIMPTNFPSVEVYEKDIKEYLKERSIIGTPTLICEKSIFDKMGYGFDESLPQLEDYELALRIAQNVPIGYYPVPLVKAHRVGECITNNWNDYVVAVRSILLKHYPYLDVEQWIQRLVNVRICNSELGSIYDEEMDSEIVPLEIRNLYKKKIIKEYDRYIPLKKKLYCAIWENEVESLRNKKFAIYGIGLIAKKVYEYLKGRALIPEFFIQTNKGEEDYFDNIKIISVDQCKEKDITILVCTSIKYSEEIYCLLHKLNFSNIIIYDDFLKRI